MNKSGRTRKTKIPKHVTRFILFKNKKNLKRRMDER